MNKEEIAVILMQAQDPDGYITIKHLPDYVQVYVYRLAKRTGKKTQDIMHSIIKEYQMQASNREGRKKTGYKIKDFSKKFFDKYGIKAFVQVQNALEECLHKGKIYGMQVLYPEIYGKVTSYAFSLGITADDMLSSIYGDDITMEKRFYFVTEKQEKRFMEKMYPQKNITQIREDFVAFKSLCFMAQEKQVNVYEYMRQAGYVYSPVAKALDFIELLYRNVQKLNQVPEYCRVPEKLETTMQILLEKTILTKPNLCNEPLTEEEILGELGYSSQGQGSKIIYTDAVCLKLYAEFVKYHKKKNQIPSQHLYENLSVAYAVTKMANIRELPATLLAEYLDKHVHALVKVRGPEEGFTPSLPLNLAQRAGKIVLVDSNVTKSNSERAKKEKTLDNPEETVYTTNRK